jgi:esterase/lipase superfamily enzyme
MVLKVSCHSIRNNKLGFEQRKATGRAEGINLEKELIKYKFNKKTKKIAIVCHSMGYASAVGMIDYLKSKNYVLRRLYIIAPKNE